MKPCDLVVKEYPIPFTLRKDQANAINKVCSEGWKRASLFMDVGTGKTVVATLIALWMALAGKVDRILIVMPPILLTQWPDWIKEFPDLTTAVYYGTPKKRAAISLDVDVVFTTPGMFKNDFEYLKGFYEKKRTMLIIDEAAMLRKIDTLIYSAVREFVLNLKNKYLLMLTGTALGAPEHSYAYMSINTPEVYRDHLRFILRHVVYTDAYGRPSKYKNLDVMQKNLMLRTIWTKADEVLDMPEVTCAAKIYNLTPAHYKLYSDLVEYKLLELDNGKILDGLIPERMIHTCQKMILCPAEYGGEKIVPAGFALIDNFIEELGISAGSNEKLIIYSNYQAVNEAVFKYVTEKLKVKAVLAYGKNGTAKNLKALGQFLNTSSVKVLVAHPISIGIGVNCQHVCRAVLFLEPPLTANIYTQALGRVLRDGQKRKIIVWLACAKRTIQVALRRNSANREDMVQLVMKTKLTLRKALFGEGG